MNEDCCVMYNIIDEDIKWMIEKYPVPWELLRGKTVMVTGAAGFLAAYMVETVMYLNTRENYGTTIIAVVRDKEKFRSRYERFSSRKELIYFERDVCNPFKSSRNIDYIVHAASKASPKYYASDPVSTLSANTIGTKNMLEIAREHQLEGFLFISTAEVYGKALHIPTSEADYGYLDPLDVRSCYAESKRMGENMCCSWGYQYGIPVRMARPFHTYGPGMSLDDGRVYADFVSDAVHGRDITIKSDGLARRAFCYIADAIAGFWMVLLNGENGEAYNIGNPECVVSVRELAEIVSGLSPETIVTKFENRNKEDSYLESEIDITCPDISKAKKLGWHPSTSIELGFGKTIKSYCV